jgi:hypothetical protein
MDAIEYIDYIIRIINGRDEAIVQKHYFPNWLLSLMLIIWYLQENSTDVLDAGNTSIITNSIITIMIMIIMIIIIIIIIIITSSSSLLSLQLSTSHHLCYHDFYNKYHSSSSTTSTITISSFTNNSY